MWEAWCQRERAVGEAPKLTPLLEAIHAALAMPPGTVVIADRQDAVTAGFPGDSVEVVRSLLDLGVKEPLCTIVTDPAFVRRAAQAGVGATVTSPLGGTWGGALYGPLDVTARVRVLSDGTLMKSREPRPGHLEISNTTMGQTAVVQIAGTIMVVVTSVPVMSTEPTVYRSVGIEPLEYRLVVTKSVNQQRFHYPDAAGFIDLDAPGWGRTIPSYAWQRRPPTRVYPKADVSDAEIQALLAPLSSFRAESRNLGARWTVVTRFLDKSFGKLRRNDS